MRDTKPISVCHSRRQVSFYFTRMWAKRNQEFYCNGNTRSYRPPNCWWKEKPRNLETIRRYEELGGNLTRWLLSSLFVVSIRNMKKCYQPRYLQNKIYLFWPAITYSWTIRRLRTSIRLHFRIFLPNNIPQLSSFYLLSLFTFVNRPKLFRQSPPTNPPLALPYTLIIA